MHTAREAQRDATRLWRLCLIHGRPDAARVREVVDRLVETRRGDAPAVLAHFRRVIRLESARWSARVESAVPLEADDRTAVQAAVARCYGGPIETTFAIDPALIGGMCVTVGSHVYDGSVRARLAAIEARFGADPA